MNYDIRIGDYKIKTLDSVNIVKSVENLTDKATIVIPGTHINRSLEVEDMLKEGDVVAISLGYDNDLKTEFTGYLSGISTDDSTIKLICEDALYLFKKSLKDREIKSIRLKKLLSDIIDEINTINKTNGTITNYKLDCDFDFGYSKFVLYKATGLDALQKIQEETKANIYFEGETLHVHAVYSYIVNEQAVVFDFAKNIEKSDLKYMRAKDKKIEVEVKIVKPDGKITSEKFGNPGGIKTTRTVSAESASDLKKIAEN
ncbi:MAG: hypothetical protein LBI60_05445 [Bacteroidales bacterium]|nr:hypothetical protein [Bacteroidales bacterium]